VLLLWVPGWWVLPVGVGSSARWSYAQRQWYVFFPPDSPSMRLLRKAEVMAVVRWLLASRAFWIGTAQLRVEIFTVRR